MEHVASEAFQKLVGLLRDLFLFDHADLDFGLYRIFKLRRKHVEEYLEVSLPRKVREAFRGLQEAEAEGLRAQIDEVRNKVADELGDDVFGPDGDVKPEFREPAAKTPRELVARYRELHNRQAGQEASEDLENLVFSHLHEFFFRYYDAADFMPKRRYGAREAYAVPYDGSETFFTWANRDQHYVKSALHFKDYRFTVEIPADLAGEDQTWVVRFTLTEAVTARDDVKGDTRYFFPVQEEARFDQASATLTVPFQYRLPTAGEVEGYRPKLQAGVLAAHETALLNRVTDIRLKTQLAAREADDKPTLLMQRLTHFARVHASDYFIHRDLSGFLTRELEFYVKDQVLGLADIEGDLAAKLRVVKVFRTVAEDLIAFLAQVEEIQKRFFEKKKLVLRTDWMVPVRHVPRDLWPQVLANETQRQAWKDLFGLEPGASVFNAEGEVNEAVLEAHPTLVVDTAFFDEAFKLAVLAAFENLDESTDGVLVRGENYQALRLLGSRWLEQVKCIYFDPPYNTGGDGFAYKDSYQHSSWLTMISGRAALGLALSSQNGVIMSSVNDIEHSALRMLFDGILGSGNHIGNLVWKGATDNNPTRIAVEHEYIICYAKSKEDLEAHWSTSTSEIKQMMLDAFDNIRATAGSVTEIQSQFEKFTRLHREELGDLYRYRRVDEHGPYAARRNMENPGKPGYKYDVIHRTTGKPCAMPYWGWRFPESTMTRLLADDKIIFGKDETKIPELKVYLKEVSFPLRSVLVLDARKGSNDLDRLFASRDVFKNPKPTELLAQVLPFAAPPAATVLDFFAGSGTTGHAVINLNRDDGGHRKFILVEMGDHFDTVLKPRIAKVMFTPEWKDGRPKRLPTAEEADRTPHLIKVLRIESYEDALHNLAEAETDRERAHRESTGDNYLLRYFSDLVTGDSPSMLGVERIEHPFDYGLEVLTDSGPERQAVDLVETFNLLLGLRVQRIETWTNPSDGDRMYRVVNGAINGERVLVVWRNLTGLDAATDRNFVESSVKLAEFDRVYTNGDAAFRCEAIEPVFRRALMEGPA